MHTFQKRQIITVKRHQPPRRRQANLPTMSMPRKDKRETPYQGIPLVRRPVSKKDRKRPLRQLPLSETMTTRYVVGAAKSEGGGRRSLSACHLQKDALVTQVANMTLGRVPASAARQAAAACESPGKSVLVVACYSEHAQRRPKLGKQVQTLRSAYVPAEDISGEHDKIGPALLRPGDGFRQSP